MRYNRQMKEILTNFSWTSFVLAISRKIRSSLPILRNVTPRHNDMSKWQATSLERQGSSRHSSIVKRSTR